MGAFVINFDIWLINKDYLVPAGRKSANIHTRGLTKLVGIGTKTTNKWGQKPWESNLKLSTMPFFLPKKDWLLHRRKGWIVEIFIWKCCQNVKLLRVNFLWSDLECCLTCSNFPKTKLCKLVTRNSSSQKIYIISETNKVLVHGFRTLFDLVKIHQFAGALWFPLLVQDLTRAPQLLC